MHEAKATSEDKWRVFAYQKSELAATVSVLSSLIQTHGRGVDLVLGPIRSFHKRIESEEEARSINGVGEKTAKKVKSSVP